MRLVTRFILALSTVVTVLAVAISLYLIRREERDLTREAERQASVLVKTLSLGLNSATFLERRDLLIDYFDRLAPESEGHILYVMITDLNGFAWLDTSRGREYQILQDPVTEEIGRRLATERIVAKKFSHPNLKEEVLEVATPIVGHDRDRGILRIGFSLKPLRDQIRTAVLSSLLIGLVSLTAGILLSVFLAGGVTRPISQVIHYARRVSQGELSGPHPGLNRTREIAELSEAIERMKRDLKYIYVGGLFRDLSHSLKSDLSFLYAELELIREKGGTRPIGDVQALVDRLDRMTQQIEKYKQFQKPADLKKGRIETAVFLKNFRDRLSEPDRTSLQIEIGEKLPAILADPVYLERALGHLLKNAQEASENGQPVVLKAVEEKGQLCLTLIDKGVGIGEEEMNRIFEPGFSTKGSRGGEGLGLALARMIIEDLHNGRIGIESRSGEGTRVKITLSGDA